ncbi:transglycosylase SLT domain-containing protein [Flexivirga sp. ID2601S]|uniref:Transglycosylase SLT domain-containing protein n=1 Tax=Flexivirga aerilata TaxID=1656889 RepID=A0A849AIQ7_9MICO|nr:transglycosylase SLT domain-containing protein [Flexivirga aerilata]NNG39843.1 transglycosylase SLT domain-containing protein [Flexivirga aerilata]
MAPITAGAPPATAHAIHAEARTTKPAAAPPKKSKAPAAGKRHASKAAKTPARSKASYTIRAGDNLTTIAKAHKVSLAALLKANKFSDPNRVLVGDRIVVPVPAGGKQTAKPVARKTPAKPHTYGGLSPKQVLKKGRSATKAALAATDVPSRSQTKALIEQTARRYGVNRQLALGIGWQESGWNQRAVSSVNAVGVMQVMPQSGEWASGMVGHNLDLLEARDNVTAGVAILRYLTANAKDLDQAIGSYYQGLGAMRKHGPYEDTKAYIRSVRAHMERM